MRLLVEVRDLFVTVSHGMDVVDVKEGEVDVFVIFLALVTSTQCSLGISIHLEM